MVKPFVSKYPDIFRIDERRHVMSKDITLLEEISEQDLSQVNGAKRTGVGRFYTFTKECDKICWTW